jgi:hypothetical protein
MQVRRIKFRFHIAPAVLYTGSNINTMDFAVNNSSHICFIELYPFSLVDTSKFRS